MIKRKKDPWQKLASGLYVPPYLKFAPGYPCCCESGCLCPTGSTSEIEIVIPHTISVRFSGIATCDDSVYDDAIPGTFLLSWFDHDTESCVFTYQYPLDSICSDDGLQYSIVVHMISIEVRIWIKANESSTEYWIDGDPMISTSHSHMHWRRTGGDYDCDSSDTIDAPYIGAFGLFPLVLDSPFPDAGIVLSP